MLRQSVAYPSVLADLVDRLVYKDDWSFTLRDCDRGQGSAGLTLEIRVLDWDSYHPDERIAVRHLMIVPAAAWGERAWMRWLFDQIGLVERHERMEHFLIGGDRPYAPLHGPGEDPYMVAELATDVQRRTSFRGVVKDG